MPTDARAPAATRALLEPALVVILAGVAAALHVGKLPPAIGALQLALGLSLVQAGFLLSLVQLAGMAAGLALGVLADGLGPRRSMLIGLLWLAAVSAAGGVADGVPALMLLRAAEGLGFLLVVLPAPGLVRRLVAPARTSTMLGIWGAYMPLATALALLAGPLVIGALGWRAWWWLLAASSLAMALWLARAVPADRPGPAPAGAAAPCPPAVAAPGWTTRLRHTLAAPGPWLVGLCFAVYSSQWLAVIGFLPAIYGAAGLPAAATGALTALVAGVNMVGNIGAGRLLQRGWPAPRLLRIGFVAMALSAALAFAGAPGLAGDGAGSAVPLLPLVPAWLRYLALLAFSALGGLIPATLFALSVRLAPGEAMIASTVGWVQQWSACGQFAGPPLVAWVASRAGGWQLTWLATGACCLLGLALSVPLARLLGRRQGPDSKASAR